MDNVTAVASCLSREYIQEYGLHKSRRKSLKNVVIAQVDGDWLSA